MKSISLFLLALLFTAMLFARAAEVQAEVETEIEAEAEIAEEEAERNPSASVARPARCSFTTTVRTNFNVAHAVCKPGYTNAQPSVQGRCFASFEVASAWCDADPACDAVGCSSWLGGKASGRACEPRASKDGKADGPWNGQDSYMCVSPPKPTSAPTPAPTPAPTRAPTPPAKCNWRLNDGFDLRGTPLCKPGYTNLHPNNPNLRGRCKAQPDEAAKWCNADPNCDAVQCTAWNVPDEGCEPVSTKGATGVVDPVRGHKSAFICERTPKRPGVEYWPHFG